jgi:hypothetical protein
MVNEGTSGISAQEVFRASYCSILAKMIAKNDSQLKEENDDKTEYVTSCILC